MGNMKTQQNTCFWKEINEYNILIPNYQRDYAQGRTDGGRIDNIRQIFVSELYQALSEDKAKCHLGLVFGSYNDDTKTFVAVDGQQRLTTVFLLHWFVAWKENRLKNYADKLKRFTWNTRSYSSQFVNLLFTLEPSDDVILAITENCNYFSVWENDPTVKSMKIMLKEIEKQYPNKQQLCDSLFSDACKIKYDILKLEKESDARTYLKMNSRGRSLTTFENFKSNLITYFDIETKKFDNEWLDFMLERSKTKGEGFKDPDIQFMNYINEYTYLQSKLKDQNDSKLFIEAKLKDGESDVPFISFEKYKSVFDKDIIEKFEKSLDWIVRYYDAIEKIDRQIDFDSDFYLEMIIKDNKPGYSHRVKFFSLLKYAELSEYSKLDETSFRRWTRVFRNLVENSEIYEDEMTNVSKYINEINDKNIYSYLSKGNILKGFYQDQIAEEIEKARQIIKNESWEAKFIEAEGYAFFNGAIRFLFPNPNENLSDCDWGSFGEKFKNAKEYFSNEDCISNNILRYYISLFDKKEYFIGTMVYDSKKDSWRDRLLNKNLYVVTDKFLKNYKCDVDKSYSTKLEYQKDLVTSKLLDCIVDGCILHESNDVLILYPGNAKADWKKYVIGTKRNLILSKCWAGKIEESNPRVEKIFSDQKMENCDFFWGWYIWFVYHGEKFQWNTDGNIYLLDSNWHWIQNNKNSENYECYHLSTAKMDMDNMTNNPDQFTKALDKLIESCSKEKTS